MLICIKRVAHNIKKNMQVHVAIYSKVIEISIHLSCILFDYIATVIGYKFSILLRLYTSLYTKNKNFHI